MKRFPFLDWMRGLAVIVMIQCHAFNSFVRMDVREGGPYILSQFVGGMAAPLFLFMAGMTLIDRTDGVLMVGAYGWAFIKPIRKLYYNLAVTFVSVAVALLIGGLEAVGMLKDRLNLSGWGWELVGNLNDNLGTLGFAIAGVFALSWIGSAVIYRVKGFDRLESPLGSPFDSATRTPPESF